MTFDEMLTQVREQLQREGRVAYRILKRRFDLSDDDLEDLKADLIDAKRVAADEDGKVLVWVGRESEAESENRRIGETERPKTESFLPQSPTPSTQSLAERRQLTVMFCDLVGSTALSEQLDPEDLREVVRAYQETCTAVIRRYEGHLAQHLGDGLLVYFGYPAAHEDDAARAVRASLEIIKTLRQQVPSPLRGEGQGEGEKLTPLQNTPHPSPLPQGARGLQVRIGIHTGLVVIGEIGSSEKREILALGETPNIAARVQGIAEPDTVIISAATHRLVQGLFECQDLGAKALKGISTPLSMYQVVRESVAQSRFEAAVGRGLTPLVGREEELGLLQRRWAQAKEGAGQVMLLSGEPGIGKSRLVQELKDQIITEGTIRIEFHCSPYHQNSAFYPLIEHLQRLLQFAPHNPPQAKLGKLQQALMSYRFPQTDTLPLLAALLSLPHPESAPPLTLSPQKQKQKTQEALVAWIVEEAERAPVYCAWEDLHWADPSTLELLTLYLEQIPTTRIFTILTCRPDFTAPWGPRSYFTQLTLNRLGRRQVEAMVERVTGGKALPSEIVQQIVTKTDGVPLFVEELTKSVVETIREQATGIGEQESNHVGAQSVLSSFQVGIPSTLQDALMARLDRLGPIKEIAQLGATLGREFSYELLHAVSQLDEELLQQGLRQLIEAELVYQSGLAPRARYLFKHALVQDTAYQSLLKSRRQQYHQQIAQVLAERFPETTQTQPELLAHHYTEAGLKEQAIPYWQQAGERASQRSAYVEAIAHLARGLELLKTLPDAPERVQQELTLQLALGAALFAVKGYAAPEVEKAYTRARELCQQVGETPQLFPVLFGLAAFRLTRGEVQIARELSEQLLRLAQRVPDLALLVAAQNALGETLCHLGEFVLAREHLEQGIAVYDPQTHHSFASLYGADQGEQCLCYAAFALWHLGYPDQALKRIREALTLARAFPHSYNLVYGLFCAAFHHQFRREGPLAGERAEAVMVLATEQGFPWFLALGTIVRGWSLSEQGQVEEGIAQMQQGLEACRATGAELSRPYNLALLAEAYEKMGQVEKGLTLLAEALAVMQKTGDRLHEAELYRLKGELLLAQAREQATGNGQQERVTDP